MPRKPLGPRSSGAQLWAEVERLRSSTDEARTAELTTELERARAREKAALDELAAARMGASERGIVDISVGGKPALAGMRKLWERFADAVGRLPTVRRSHGFSTVRLVAAKDLLADLMLFELDAPHGPAVSTQRHLLRRQLTHPAQIGRAHV